MKLVTGKFRVVLSVNWQKVLDAKFKF